MRSPLASTDRAETHFRLAWAWLGLWGLSLTLPVAQSERGYSDIRGWFMLLLGWLGPLAGQFAWFGNFTFLALTGLALLRARRRRSALLLTGATLAFAFNGLFWRDMYDDAGEARILLFAAGFYVWQIALIGASLATLWRWMKEPRD